MEERKEFENSERRIEKQMPNMPRPDYTLLIVMRKHRIEQKRWNIRK